MASARQFAWCNFNRLIGLCLAIVCLGCAPIRAPESPMKAEWPRPVLPALVQPAGPDAQPDELTTSAVNRGRDKAAEDSVAAPDFDRQRFDLVAEGVAAGDVFAGLAKHASLSLAVHLPLPQPVWLSLSQRPLVELLDAVAAQCACRYELVANRIDVFADEPFLKSYPLDYLNIERRFESDLSVDTGVGNLDNAGSAQGDASSAALNTRLVSQPWETVVQGLALILELPVEEAHRVIGIHPGAGLVTVRATQARHADISRYLKRVVSRLQRQVLIEASVIEISLDERHAAGVDWQQLANAGGVGWVQQLGDLATTGGAVLQFSESTAAHTTTATVRLLQHFGDVRVVSAPRIVALNNQPSVLKVVDNAVYFSMNVEREVIDESGRDRQTVETAIHTVPIGLVLHVTPQISERGEVLMNIRPSISRVVRYASDPNPTLAEAGVQNDIPEIQTRELDTTLRVRSGHTVALGGLRQLSDGTHRETVPGLDRLPLIGNLFRSRGLERRQVELLILLTPHVLPSDGVL